MQFECGRCKLTKPDSDFYRKSDGKLSTSRCKDCVKAVNRERYNSSPELQQARRDRGKRYAEVHPDRNKEYGRDYYATVKGRAKTMLASSKRGGRRKFEDIDNDLDLEFIIRILEPLTCSVTGLSLTLDRPSGTIKNPYAPSLDRIDHTKGYTKDNVRIVCWQYNLMKGELTDEETREFCRKVLENGERLDL